MDCRNYLVQCDHKGYRTDICVAGAICQFISVVWQTMTRPTLPGRNLAPAKATNQDSIPRNLGRTSTSVDPVTCLILVPPTVSRCFYCLPSSTTTYLFSRLPYNNFQSMLDIMSRGSKCTEFQSKETQNLHRVLACDFFMEIHTEPPYVVSRKFPMCRQRQSEPFPVSFGVKLRSSTLRYWRIVSIVKRYA